MKATLVIGTIGDDAHSMGIKVLEYAFQDAGFKVVSLGIQTPQDDFVKAAVETAADAIMVSSMSGHARMLCPELREKCIEAGLKDILLYVGGYLTTGESTWEETEKLFKDMGYNRAYPPGSTPSQILADLQKDLDIKPDKTSKKQTNIDDIATVSTIVKNAGIIAIRNKKIDDDEFARLRKEVLAQWPTGKDVDMDEAVAYHKSMPAQKNMVKLQNKAKKKGNLLIFSRAGYTTIEQHSNLLTYLQNEGHSDLLLSLLDSFTRTLQFQKSVDAIKESERTGKNMLNGFPVVAHGISGNRKVLEMVDKPMGVEGPTPDARLATEIGLAAGYTNRENSWVIGMGQSKTSTPEQALRNFMYCDRLTGMYEERGVPIAVVLITAESSALHCPLSVSAALRTVSALMLATQGVKNIRLRCQGRGNLSQDIADSVLNLKLVREYLDKFGFKDVELCLANGTLSGAYSIDEATAFAEVLYAPILSVLSQALVCEVKTFDEAVSIPTIANQVKTLRAARMMANMLRVQNIDMINTPKVQEEMRYEEMEVRAIINKIFEFGDGDVAVGVIKAFEMGVVDGALPANQHTRGNVMSVRDAQGAIRWLRFGNLPFTEEMKDFHRRKLAERAKIIGKDPDFDTIVADHLALSRGSLIYDDSGYDANMAKDLKLG